MTALEMMDRNSSVTEMAMRGRASHLSAARQTKLQNQGKTRSPNSVTLALQPAVDSIIEQTRQSLGVNSQIASSTVTGYPQTEFTVGADCDGRIITDCDEDKFSDLSRGARAPGHSDAPNEVVVGAVKSLAPVKTFT